MPWSPNPPKNDNEYFEKLTHAVFQAGLNWKMVENKWPAFRKAFSNFSIDKVAGYGMKDIEVLMGNKEIIRNERKIESTIFNAQEFQKIRKEFGSFSKYVSSFRGSDSDLSDNLQERFRHLGASSARMYMWMIGIKLKPTAEEKAWLSKHEN
jgi:3-methyladenine DNA glycosylase Tag